MSALLAKARRDLTRDKTRSVLAVLAIALGIWGMTSVVTTYVVSRQDLRDNYLNTRPAAATLWVTGEGSPLPTALAQPGVTDAQLRTEINGRIQTGPNVWSPLKVFVVDDFEDLRIHRFTLEQGRWPQEGQLLIEREGRSIAPLSLGQSVTVRFLARERVSLQVTGWAHDPGLAPSRMDHLFYGYMDRKAAAQKGLLPSQQQLVITTQATDRERIAQVAQGLALALKEQGFSVNEIDVPIPGRHPHQDQLGSLLLLQLGVGGAAVVLSVILIGTLFAFMIARQAKEIAILKTVGASTAQLIGLYSFQIQLLAVVGTAIGIPLGLLSSRAFTALIAQQLNFNRIAELAPIGLVASLALAGLLLPMIAAAVPLFSGVSRRIVQGLRDVKSPAPAGALQRIRWVPALALMALRNGMRRPARMAVTAGTLAVGLAALLAAINLGASLDSTVQSAGRAREQDLEVVFAAEIPREQLSAALQGVEGVQTWEAWAGGAVSIRHGDGEEQGARYRALVPPSGKRPALTLISGEWPQAGDPAVVINHLLMKAEPALRPGAFLTVELEGKARRVRIAGVVRDLGSPALAYFLTDEPTQSAVSLRIKAKEQATPETLLQSVEGVLENRGIAVAYALTRDLTLTIVEDHLLIIVGALSLIAALVLAVGALGLVSTMGIQMLERRREYGVLRAIGASPRRVVELLAIEGALVGSISWFLGSVLSWPLSHLLSSFFGKLFLASSLDPAVSCTALFASAAGVVIFSAASASFPAWNGAQASTRSLLSYE